MTDEDRMRFTTNEFYIKSPEEMYEHFTNVPEAIENTVKIAEECNVEFEFGVTKLPHYDVPEEFPTHDAYFRKLCDDGIKKDMEILFRKKQNNVWNTKFQSLRKWAMSITI